MRREALWEYVRGALWVLPTLAVVVALVAGSTLSLVDISESSWTSNLVFQGTADDARALLVAIASTMVTVIALVLGLTVVALQLASTQFSPRLLRNFLRDGVNQVVLSVFVATFAYSSAGLYTVGVSAGHRVDSYPRLAVTGALVLLFASLLMLVFFVHHLAHSIQIDEVMAQAQGVTLRVIHHTFPPAVPTDPNQPTLQPPPWARPLLADRSGYVQTIHAEVLLRVAVEHRMSARVVPMVGDHVIEGSPLVWVWALTPPTGDSPATVSDALRDAVRIGNERTMEQDAAFGVRQLADIGAKALSPAVNDPYTAVQALDHLSVILAALAGKQLGDLVLYAGDKTPRVVAPGRDFAYYLDLACGQLRRYGRAEPRVVRALLRILAGTGRFCQDPARRALVAAQIRLVLADAESAVIQPLDLEPLREQGREALRDL